MHNWNAERVSHLLIDMLRNVGADEATVTAVRVAFAREAIDGCALTRLGQQDLSQRFGVPIGVVLRLLYSLLSRVSVASVRSQLVCLPVADAAACSAAESDISTIVVSDATMRIQPPEDTSDVTSVPIGVAIVSFSMR